MLRRSSFIVAAASMAAQAGPAAVLLCDQMLKEIGRDGEPLSEREILMARAAAAARAERGQKKASAWRMPRVNFKGIATGLGLRKPRLAA